MAEPLVSNVPSSLDNDTSLGGDVLNLKQYTLDAGINNSVTTISVAEDITSFNVPGYILIDSELIWVGSKSAGDFATCTRGAGGTTAASHSNGAPVYHTYAANYFNQLKRAIVATEPAGFPPQSGLLNGQIVVSVASNNLTVAIKSIDGNNPSTTNPVYVRIGNTIRKITAALSVTKNAGTNWCNAGSAELATKLVNYFVYLGYNATDGVVIGFSRIPYARAYGDFSATSTLDRYAAISTITSAVSTDVYENVGRFSATLSAGAGYTWTISGTGDVINRPVYETDWLAWVPVLGGFSVAPTWISTRYKVQGNILFFYLRDSAAGTSNATTFTISVPFTTLRAFLFNVPYYQDTGTLKTGVGVALSTVNSNVLDLSTADFNIWTASGAKVANLNTHFELT